MDKINAISTDTAFSNTSDKKIKSILFDIWGKERIKTIDCYNVGKGNADYIRGCKNRMLYDIGYSFKKFPKKKGRYNYYRACDAIRKIQPSCVVLSHWDTDHILGCVYAEQRIFDIPWIAPSLENKGKTKYSINAYRLARYLDTLNNLYLVDCLRGPLKIANIKTKDGAIGLYLGGGKDSYITDANKQGVYIEIYSRNIHILLSGDVPYACMMQQVRQCNIDYLHVPHHCSKMKYNNLINCKRYGKVAIISTDRRDNDSINCDDGHKKYLEKKFKEVVCTIDNKIGDDNCNLSYQIDVIKNTSNFR